MSPVSPILLYFSAPAFQDALSGVLCNKLPISLGRDHIAPKSYDALHESYEWSDHLSSSIPPRSSSGVTNVGTYKPRIVLTRLMWANLFALAR